MHAANWPSRVIPTDLDILDVENWRVAYFELAPDLSQILAQTESADRKEPRVLLWAPADDQRLELGQLFVVSGVAFSPDGTLVAASSITGITKVWDARTGQEIAKLTGFMNSSLAVAFSPDGKRLVVGGGGDGLCRLWDVETWRELITLRIDGQSFSTMRFSPDGNVLGAKIDSVANTGAYGYWQCWRAPSWEEIAMAEAKERFETK